MLLLSLHPVLQLCAIVLAWYVFWLGFKRFRVLHLGQTQVSFNWKRHVLLGKIALCLLLLGALGGMGMVYLHWRRVFIAGIHAEIAMVIVPLGLFGLASGIFMDLKKKNRTLLPAIHGINNAVLLLLTIAQIISGIGIYRSYVLGL